MTYISFWRDFKISHIQVYAQADPSDIFLTLSGIRYIRTRYSKIQTLNCVEIKLFICLLFEMYLNADRETNARITDYFIVSQILNYIRLSGLRFNKFSVYCCFIVFLQRSYKTFIPAFWSRYGLWQKTQKWKKNITCVIKFSIKEARNKTRIDSIHYQWQQTRKGMACSYHLLVWREAYSNPARGSAA